ncbi:MAG: GNAT family N-acetyltransferase [Anaerolineae bacterium]|nr:GNAT family N-acetyltransferase [Anaerolineae bacterium]
MLYAISELTDIDRIREYLKSDIHYAAYSLGDLEPPYSEHATWYAASRTGEIEGLALVYRGLKPPILFLMGDVSALSAMLLYGIGPDEIFFNIKPDVRKMLESFYKIEEAHTMTRMRITGGIFKPIENTADPPTPIVTLGKEHVADIINLQEEASRADGRDTRDVAFSPEMIEDGYYRGIYQDDRLVAAAGTHIVARQAGMAAVGNVVVHPEHRQKGLGSLVSQAVTQALIDDKLELIVLNVRQNNQPAVKIYRKLGYRQVSTFIEGAAGRRQAALAR